MQQTQNLPAIDSAIETYNARLNRKSFFRLREERNYHNGMSGMTGEHFTFQALLSLLPRKLKRYFIFGKNPFNYYQYKKNKEIGADIKVHIKTPTGKTILIEVKNWQKQFVQYGIEIAKTEVLKRFEGQDADVKILIISYKDCFSEKAIIFLESKGIIILELGFHVKLGETWTREMFAKFLYHKIGNTINRNVLRQIFCISKLSNRLSSNYIGVNRLNIKCNNNTNNNAKRYNNINNITNKLYIIDGVYIYDIDYSHNPLSKQTRLYFEVKS
jgi:hypothetical protein